MARADKPSIGRRVQIRQPYLPVVQCIINNQHPDPTLDTNSPSPGATSNHLTILVPNPLPTILTGVRRTVDWAFSSRPQSLPIASENSTIVTSNTGVKEILQCMVERRCPDVTSDLSPMTAIPRPYTGGGYGDVYKWSKKDGSIVSIKCLRIYENSESTPKSTKRISRELYHLFRASHPNVLELTGVALFNGQIAIVSPWMKNGNLRKYIRSQPEVDRWSLCIQIAEGLAHIHSIKMVHGDLKAENILVSDQGVVKISDFGNSILEECSLRYTATSRVGGGTSRWMAWELFSDPPANISATTDVHSLGMTLLEVMTGEYPYAEYKGNISVLGPLSEKRLPKRPEAFASHRRWGDERWALLLDCWNVDPNLRPDSLKVLNRMKELQ